MANFTVQGDVKSRTNGQPVQGAQVEIFQVDNPSPGVYTTTPLTKPVFTGDKPWPPGYFKLSFTFASPPRPNVVFRVSQQVSGAFNCLYTENPATDTRWAIADVLNVHFKVDGAITKNDPDPSQPGPPPGAYFVFTRVSKIPVANISQTSGYAYPNDGPPPPSGYKWTTKDADAPFGGTLWIGGWFGMGLSQTYGAKYYKIEYAPGPRHAGDPGQWTPITDALTNWWYDQLNHNWVVEAMGPVPPNLVGGIENLYKLPHDQGSLPWAFQDLLITLDTTKIPNGLCTLRVVGYDGNLNIIGDNTEATWFSSYVDLAYGQLPLQLDNSPPVCLINPSGHGVKLNGVELHPCDIKTLGLASSDILEVEFEAYDPNGHLREYSLNAIYGHDQVVLPYPNKAVDDYSAHIDGTHHWQGAQSYTTGYEGHTYDKTKMPQCAYNLRLSVNKRTTDGCGLVYWGYEDNYLITLMRP